MRRCCTCKETKSLDDFYADHHGRGGRRTECKVCVRRRSTKRYWAKRDEIRAQSRDDNYRKKYGQSVAGYDQMLAEQGGRCAICQSTSPGRWDKFHFDHDHETGGVRGLLCAPCNMRLGVLENSQWMAQAANYLIVFRKPGRRKKA